MTGPYELSASSGVIANRFYEILNANKVTLSLQDVWFGDQDMVPRTPSACVEPGLKRRRFQGVPDMTLNEIDTVILLYHSVVGQEQQQARRDCIEFAEELESYLHINHLQLFDAGGTNQLTITSFCTDLDPGYVYKANTLHNAVRMVWTSTTKTSLRRPY